MLWANYQQLTVPLSIHSKISLFGEGRCPNEYGSNQKQTQHHKRKHTFKSKTIGKATSDFLHSSFWRPCASRPAAETCHSDLKCWSSAIAFMGFPHWLKTRQHFTRRVCTGWSLFTKVFLYVRGVKLSRHRNWDHRKRGTAAPSWTACQLMFTPSLKYSFLSRNALISLQNMMQNSLIVFADIR